MENREIVSAGCGYGEHGRGDEYKLPHPIENFPTTNLSCISTGSSHCIALYKDGSVLGGGKSYDGLICFPKKYQEVEFPTKINDLPNIIDIKCGTRFTLYLTEEKKVLITSSNEHKNNFFEEIKIGEPAVALFGFWDPWIVGESGAIYWYDYDRTKRIRKFGPFPFGIPKQIVSIEYSVLLLTSKGETLGMSMKKLRPDDFKYESADVVCESEDHFSLIESLRDVKIKKISGLQYHFLALSEDNKVFAWGQNLYGQLGVGDKKHRYNGFVRSTVSEKAKIVDIAAGKLHSIFVDSTGHVWGFGVGSEGQTMLGENENEGPLSKVIECALSAYCGDSFSFVLIGNSPLPEAGTLNLICKKGKVKHSGQKQKKHHSKKCFLS